jgi:hypothetical protein
MLSKGFLYAGSLPARPLELRAGPLSLFFEPHTAFLRRLRLGDHEVVRALYAAVRDENWATITPRVTLREHEVKSDSFRLAFDGMCQRGGIDYFWRGEVTGNSTGSIRYSFDGEARSEFLRNRIGICVLHPITECAGRPVAVAHTDGATEQGSFPRDISPHQPFFDVRGLSYEVANTGITAELEMTGDTFEMEDQRNWTDASFKTYCTPLALPLPHRVQPGDRVRQSVTLRLTGKVRPVLPVLAGRPPQLSIATTPAMAPVPLGLCLASHGRALTPREIERLKALRLGHLRVDLRLDDPGHPAQMERATAEAAALAVGLHVALTLCDHCEAPLAALAEQLARLRPPVLLWIILHDSENPTSERTVQQVRPILQKIAPTALYAAGTRDFFTEVNRVRLQPGATSSVCYSNNPQVHAFDHTTLIENLAGQVYNVESARHFTPRPVVVSPITLRIRQNTAAASERPGALTELPGDVDPRQLSLFGAGWTLASIARLSATGFVHSLTYYETTGWRGIMETEAGSPLPSAFPSEPGVVFPVYHVLADIGEYPTTRLYPTNSSHPLIAEGLTLVNQAGQRRVLLANLTTEPQELKIKSGSGTARVRYLDETTAETAVRRPEEFRRMPGEVQEAVSGKVELKLLPCAVARVDLD